jgi:putative acetyltransferase
MGDDAFGAVTMNYSMPQENLPFEITWRPVMHPDLEGLLAIYKETIDHTCVDDYDADQRNAWKQGTENRVRWTDAIDMQYFIVAEVDGNPAGFGSLKDGAYIDFLYTSKNYLRKGIAQTIYDQLENMARSCGSKHLTADVSKTARLFFEKQGFVVVNENRNFIRGVWITNFRMQKELSMGSV